MMFETKNGRFSIFYHRNNSAFSQQKKNSQPLVKKSSRNCMMPKIHLPFITCSILCSILAAYQYFLVLYPTVITGFPLFKNGGLACMRFLLQQQLLCEKQEKGKLPPPVNHQVFINFRGEQLRHNFVSHLTYAFKMRGVLYFVDKDEQLGKDLRNLFVRIEESRIALAIFSTRYPQSKWCMNELVKMKERADEGKLEIIPIFYKLEPSHVRKPTRESEFGRNFWKLMETSDLRDPIQEWRAALEFISNKIGLSLGDKSSEADFVQEIVQEVQRVIQAIVLEKE